MKSSDPHNEPIPVTVESVRRLMPTREPASNKGDNGSVLIVAGSEAMPGAAVLAVRGALRAGAGLVTIASVSAVCQAVQASLPEAIALPLPEFNGDAATVLLEKQDRFQSAVFGPGLTSKKFVLEFLANLWEGWAIPSCIDADALNAVSLGVTMPKGLCVLTPHPGEMGRLLGTSAAEVQTSRIGAVQDAVAKFGKCVLLKGKGTLATSPLARSSSGDVAISLNPTGNAGMATGGMGDVLAGVVGTLLAQGLSPYDAAVCGAYWHGLAGDICAEDIGPIGFLASEVANALPAARAKITAECESA